MRRFDSIADILLSYDMDAACVAWDGAALHASVGALHALATMTCTIDPWQSTTPQRVIKYTRFKKMAVVIPVKTSDALCRALHEEIVRVTTKLRLLREQVGDQGRDEQIGIRTWATFVMMDAWNVAQAQVLAAHRDGLISYEVLSNLHPDGDSNGRMHPRWRGPHVAGLPLLEFDVPERRASPREALEARGWNAAALLAAWSQENACRVLSSNPFDRSNYCGRRGLASHFYRLGSRATEQIARIAAERADGAQAALQCMTLHKDALERELQELRARLTMMQQ